MPKVLIIEPCSADQTLIRKSLNDRYRTTITGCAKDALYAISKSEYDLILLEARLPDHCGFHLCTEWRSQDTMRDIPILLLSKSSEIRDIVAAFAAGADDYIAKPFHPLELQARVEARIIKRISAREHGAFITRGALSLEVDMHRATLTHHGREHELSLTPTEFKLLLFFVKNEGRILSRSQILRNVWGAQIFVEDRIVDKHISTLRNKLEPKGHYIQTIPRTGYRFHPAEGEDKK